MGFIQELFFVNTYKTTSKKSIKNKQNILKKTQNKSRKRGKTKGSWLEQ